MNPENRISLACARSKASALFAASAWLRFWAEISVMQPLTSTLPAPSVVETQAARTHCPSGFSSGFGPSQRISNVDEPPSVRLIQTSVSHGLSSSKIQFAHSIGF
jgi:hypothetical protein